MPPVAPKTILSIASDPAVKVSEPVESISAVLDGLVPVAFALPNASSSTVIEPSLTITCGPAPSVMSMVSASDTVS